MYFPKEYFPKVYFPKVHFRKCISWKNIFRKCIFQKRIFWKCIFIYIEVLQCYKYNVSMKCSNAIITMFLWSNTAFRILLCSCRESNIHRGGDIYFTAMHGIGLYFPWRPEGYITAWQLIGWDQGSFQKTEVFDGGAFLHLFPRKDGF